MAVLLVATTHVRGVSTSLGGESVAGTCRLERNDAAVSNEHLLELANISTAFEPGA